MNKRLTRITTNLLRHGFSGLGMLALLTAVGCSGTSSPKVSVLSATVREKTPEGAVIDLLLEADNPNPDALPLQDVEYRVAIDGKQVFEGTRSAESILRRFGRQQFRIPAAFTLAQAPQTLSGSAFTIDGTIYYVAPGALAETLFDQNIVRPSVSFSGEGKIE